MRPKIQRMRPLTGRVLLELQPPKSTTEGGIEIPEAYRGKSTEAIVRGIGAGETDFALGDRVVINSHVPGTPITLHPRKLRLVRHADVQAVFV